MTIRHLAPLLLFLARAAKAQQPSIDIERVAPKRWRATYHLPTPATSVQFERQAGFFRERVWTVSTPGYKLTRRGDRQIVTLDSGATPTRELIFEFPEFADALP